MLKGADIVLQCLRAEGVELVFGYPGGAIMPLYDALEVPLVLRRMYRLGCLG